ncbi:MAG TPA: acyl-CoA dehydrogenase family protein [Acidimicrobiales bacterium]|jgi:alkylation response protein AidB-like acyl-CoA dehydrogenase|nr:acyl-CoA dehydrogenase family protein [Acidimicrobiales bacterium]
MDLRDAPEDVAFRAEVRRFLEENLVGEFAELGGRGGSGDETFGFETRRRWEKVLAKGGWTCPGWPVEHGGRGASVTQQVIFNEEYARAAAPGRVSIMGEGLLGPTLIHYGTPAQKARFLPPIQQGDELWCQGYSEPDAGSDLANVKTRALRDGDQWVVSGQKVWTSLAHQADWCFVVCRTDPDSSRHKGLSYLLVPMDQPGVEVRPITQLTRTSEFNEVFFDGARTDAANVVGEVGDGWRVALATLAFERGVALLGHQLTFRRELDRIVDLAEENGRAADPVVRQRLAQAHIELTIMRYNTLRSLSGIDGPVAPPEASIAKLFWGSWHRRLGELAMDLIGVRSTVRGGEELPENMGYGLDELQRSFLFARSETIYGGSNEIQRNIIGERVLGLPSEPKGVR